MFLKKYLEFSLLYKRLLSNKLPDLLDIKLKIWDFIKKMIAIDIIEKFIFINTFQCSDCFTINWKINPGNQTYNYYKAPACNIEQPYFTDTCCCEKTICSNNCYFNIECEGCGTTIYNYSPPHLNNDQGWNPIEGKNICNIICHICEYQNIIPLSMNSCSNTRGVLGKLVMNKNRFIIKNNSRIIINKHNKNL